MKMQELNFCEIFEWADRTAFADEKEITSIIGIIVERLHGMFEKVHLFYPVEVSKLNYETLFELFFELGRLQGIREGWQAHVMNKIQSAKEESEWAK